jgi:2-oxoglutarate/2-oxoacid ferredoxin oxidoreductase subunit beta
LLATIDGPSYVARTSLDSHRNLVITKKAIEKSFRYQMEEKGFSIIEILSPCPVDWHLSPKDSLLYIQKSMLPIFPLGVFKDTFQETG